MPNQNIETYSNRTLHGGVNQRLNGRGIADNEATDLINADISVPGIRTKRKEPLRVATLLNATVPATPTGTVNGTACSVTPKTVLSVNDVVLAWTAITGALYYEIKIYSGSVCGGTAIATYTVNPPFVTLTLLGGSLAAGLYSWTVQAFGDGDNYANSNVMACCPFTILSTALVKVNYEYTSGSCLGAYVPNERNVQFPAGDFNYYTVPENKIILVSLHDVGTCNPDGTWNVRNIVVTVNGDPIPWTGPFFTAEVDLQGHNQLTYILVTPP